MTTARDLMTHGAECVGENETLQMTDRDIVVRCLAEGGDPSTTTAGSLARGKPVTIGADDSAEEALRTMATHQVRRLPVIAGHDLVGMVAQADVARALDPQDVGRVLQEVSDD
ncbi:CBS domain-containing protein [Mumia zhuanghuii]|uniref:CBS domain-containing protein n=1 Tax=Mumia zhuanghuii TaxID=2585211 RepID=A0A5C4MCL6_9ACTN|nr:CBS domain-containing protein [Mumia zhuanghuii]TNC36588.1 CBS domain-containing protein [Mumia zhuanghuii]TNC46359.1 CBS domain-containing protein [Mumia zhuanghuii]